MTSARTRIVAALALVVAVYLLLFGGAGEYTITAQFTDAGQLVTGGLVDVEGASVGHISSITLSQNGLADVRMSITDNTFAPLHQGTRALIRATGQAGVANRFVELDPGARSAPVLPSGSVLGLSQTTGIVDLDEVLDAFDPTTRANLQQLIANSSHVFAGSGSTYFNQMLDKLEPAFGQIDGFTSELAYDRNALAQLVETSSQAATAVSSRSGDLAASADVTARSLGALASQQGALADALDRLPAFLTDGGVTLGRLGSAATTLRPALLEVPPASAPLKTLLGQFNSTLPEISPVIARLRAQLPDLKRSLVGFEPLAPRGVAALGGIRKALTVAMPVLDGLRIYGADFVLGIFNGLLGIASGPYDATGHYIKIEFVQSPTTFLSGIPSELLNGTALLPGLFQTRTGQTARCPGGEEPPAADGSNPWIPDPKLCNPLDDMPLSVDQP